MYWAGSKFTRQLGWTLLELLLVLTIVGYTLAVVTPMFARSFERLDESSQLRSLVRILRVARAQALHEGKTVAVLFDPPGYFHLQGQERLYPLSESFRLRLLNEASGTKKIHTSLDAYRFFRDGSSVGGGLGISLSAGPATGAGAGDGNYQIHINPVTGDFAVAL